VLAALPDVDRIAGAFFMVNDDHQPLLKYTPRFEICQLKSKEYTNIFQKHVDYQVFTAKKYFIFTRNSFSDDPKPAIRCILHKRIKTSFYVMPFIFGQDDIQGE
jgi:hypothetical protein